MPFVAGNDIDAFCSQCGRDRNHTVIEVHGGLVHEVRCNTCKEQHRYQRPHAPPPPPPAAKRQPRARKKERKASTPAGPPAEWQQHVLAAVPESARPYALNQTFELNEVIEHSAFGTGVVTAVAPDGKIEVAFRQGRKKLVHGKS